MSKGGTVDDVDLMPARLEAFLAEAEPDATDISVLSYEPMIGGYSRVMARFELSLRRGGKEERRQLVFRADPPPDRAGFHTDRRTEWDVLAHLSAAATVSVPAPYCYCDGRHLGSPAILMDFIPSTTLLSHLSDADDLGAEAVRLAEIAADIHTVDTACLPPSLVHPGDSEEYLAQRIADWATTERAHTESDPFLRYVGAWLSAHRPPPVALTLIHGDFQSANVVVAPDGSWSVVDWEFARIGDPREDLGYFRGVASVAGPDLIAADPTTFCATYRERTGLAEEQLNPAVIRYFTILGMATVLGQILAQKAALARGELHSIGAYYVSNAISYAHMQILAIIAELEGA
jgi:aminoglycoside phosphotransferase (APT) family kinase protein